MLEVVHQMGSENSNMKNIRTEVYTAVAYYNVGIVPIDNIRHDANKALATLPASDARKMKRKFRKLHRYADAPAHRVFQPPTQRSSKNRKQSVKTFIYKKIVLPELRKVGA